MNTAIIFAAGRGRRLRPITDLKPKALCEIDGKSLLMYHLEKLAASGITRVFINHAYLGYQIRQHLKHNAFQNLDVVFFPEPPGGYRTGGTLLQNLSELAPDNLPFLAINADIFTDYDYKALQPPNENSLAHLILVNPTKYHHHNDFNLNDKHLVCNDNPKYLFSGIACYHPDFFKNKSGSRASITPWLQAAADNKQITGELHTGLWFDIGSIERLEDANHSIK